MVRCRSVLAAAGVVLLSATAHAVVPRSSPGRALRPAADTLTAMPAAALAKPLRTHRNLRFNDSQTAVWGKFALAAGGKWHAAWDAATGVPSRIWGSGIPAPGANASPAIAERIARRELAAHLALLAPGASVTDFQLVSNHSDGDQRSVGFVQRAGGLRVLGGQISFRFKRDRLFVIASEALPDVKAPPIAAARMKREQLMVRATTNLRGTLALPTAPVTAKGDDVILPFVADDSVLGYRVATPVQIDGGVEGRYLAYLDPATGDVLAVHQQNMYASGVVKYRGVQRNPARGRIDVPVNRARLTVGGAPQTTSATGAISWSPDVVQSITTAVAGDLFTIVDKTPEGTLATAQLQIAPSGEVVWDASAVETQDAQVTTFVAANTVKEFVRANLDPAFPTLDEQMVANVNIPQQCNAFYDGESINFFQSSDLCANTGLLADVVYHEFGHNLHARSIIEGVGNFDGAMSEGASDFLSAIINNDPGMGVGFFKNPDPVMGRPDPLRQLDPPNTEATWPQDVGEIHTTGIIFGGTFWDLRKALIEQLGEAKGTTTVNKLYMAALRRSVDIPSSLIETLAADDDDGNLENGSPNECAIRAAFGRHGLRTATGVLNTPGVLEQNAGATIVRVDMSGLSSRCGGDEIADVTLEWKPGFTPEPRPGSALMTKVSETRFWAQMPLARDGTMHFRAQVRFEDGSSLTLADNFADPFYTLYQGSTVKLYCTDFETEDPFQTGWSHGTGDGSASPWEWGDVEPGPTDPPVAFSGTRVLAQSIGGDYGASQYSFLQMPPIDIGQYSDVRLQFRRWLAVEDSEFDKARVTVDGKQAFVNFTANQGMRSSTHHIDREWRFTDVGVSGFGFGHTVQIAFDLSTDEGLQLGGWALDDVCVVANRNSICGDGVKSIFEQCDAGDANADRPGAPCRTYCKLPQCGDSITDEIEQCDDGPNGSSSCTPMCSIIEDDGIGGCCSTSRRGAPGALGLGLLTGLALLRRRRRASRQVALPDRV